MKERNGEKKVYRLLVTILLAACGGLAAWGYTDIRADIDRKADKAYVDRNLQMQEREIKYMQDGIDVIRLKLDPDNPDSIFAKIDRAKRR